MGTMGKIPEGWLDFSPIGNQVPGTRFIAFKVPLKEAFVDKLKPEDRFTISGLLNKIPDLGLVIDLTHTTKYYNKRDLLNSGVDYVKITTPGQVVPPQHLVERFFEVVDYYLDSHSADNTLIGVHCTHGVNRTGYMLCRYMIQRLGYNYQQAIEVVGRTRGYTIERPHYLWSLRQNIQPVEKNAMMRNADQAAATNPPKQEATANNPPHQETPKKKEDAPRRGHGKDDVRGSRGDFRTSPVRISQEVRSQSMRTRSPQQQVRGRSPTARVRTPPMMDQTRGRMSSPPRFERPMTGPPRGRPQLTAAVPRSRTPPPGMPRGRTPPPTMIRERSPHGIPRGRLPTLMPRDRSPLPLRERSPPNLRGRTPPHNLRGRTPPHNLRGRTPPHNLRGHTPPHLRGRTSPHHYRTRTPPPTVPQVLPSHHAPSPHFRERSPPPHSRGRTPPPVSRRRSPYSNKRGRSSSPGTMSRIPNSARSPHHFVRSPPVHIRPTSRGGSPYGHYRSRSPPYYPPTSTHNVHYLDGRRSRGRTPTQFTHPLLSPRGHDRIPRALTPTMVYDHSSRREPSHPVRGRTPPHTSNSLPFSNRRDRSPPAVHLTRVPSPGSFRSEMPPDRHFGPPDNYQDMRAIVENYDYNQRRQYNQHEQDHGKRLGLPSENYSDRYEKPRRERTPSPRRKPSSQYPRGGLNVRQDYSPNRDVKRRRKSPEEFREKRRSTPPSGYINSREGIKDNGRDSTRYSRRNEEEGPDCREILNEKRSMRDAYTKYADVPKYPSSDLRNTIEADKRRKRARSDSLSRRGHEDERRGRREELYPRSGYSGKPLDDKDRRRRRPDYVEERLGYDDGAERRGGGHQKNNSYPDQGKKSANDYDKSREDLRKTRGRRAGNPRVFDRLSRSRPSRGRPY